MYSVLFVCTGNSARSILAEALLNRWGQGTFRAFSAGSRPAGYVHPLALELLKKRGLPTEGLRSKSWHEFGSPEAPDFHFVFTLCDRAAAEVCPAWPGHPLTAHWGIEDPAALSGGDAPRRQAFSRVFQTLEARIKLFVILPITNLRGMQLKQRLDEIGRI
jgi:arsenate reductase (thioredoxin)